MSIEQAWGGFFKSEIKTSGFKLVVQEKISVASASDTFVQAYVRATPPCKVELTAEDIGSASFTAKCNCPAAGKSQFCKHVWATLLCVDQKYPDFLNEKKSIEKAVVISDDERREAVATAPADTQNPKHARALAAESYQAAAKVRAAEYRKAQYEKQKERVKQIKRSRKGLEASVSKKVFSPEVEDALAYFTLNGFPMVAGPEEAVVNEAKKKLSRVFHPDKGGTTAEMVELNHHCGVLLRFLNQTF